MDCRKHCAQKGRFVPGLEALESRWCPTASTVSIVHHVLVVDAVNSGDVITITDAVNGSISASITGTDSTSAQGEHVSSIRVVSKNGGDTINYHLSDVLTTGKNMNLILDGGHDHVNLDFGAGISGGAVSVHIQSKGGSDSVTATFGALANTTLAFGGNFHQGGDSVGLTFAGDVTGTTAVGFNLHALGGDDVFLVNSADIKIGSGASVLVNMTGVNGNDQFVTNWQSDVVGNLALQGRGQGGNDTITTNITVDKGSTGIVFSRVIGRRGADDLTLNVLDNTAHDGITGLAALATRIGGINGADTLNYTSNVHVLGT